MWSGTARRCSRSCAATPITDPKPRLISAAAFRDRVVHHALCAEFAPVFERVAIDDSYACRPGRGPHSAVARVQTFARRFMWYVKLDIASFFETADHGVCATLLRRWIDDPRLLRLCSVFLEAGAPGSAPGRGLPIGNLTSPLIRRGCSPRGGEST